jgi:hypothetical protein
MKLILPLLAILLFPQFVSGKVNQLKTKNFLSIEMREHNATWVLESLNVYLQRALSKHYYSQKEEIRRDLKTRIGEFVITPEGQTFFSSIPASSYIRLHRKLRELFSGDDPRSLKVIEVFMMEIWPRSSEFNLDSARKFIFLAGIYSSAPPDRWLIDPEAMLEEFRIRQKISLDETNTEVAYRLFYEVTKNMVGRSLHITPLETIGLIYALEIAGFKSSKPHGRDFFDYVCSLFLKN